jgi:hypothetical protein
MLRRGDRLSTKRSHLSTKLSLYQLMYCCNRSGGENISLDCSSHCQIKNVSKQKPFVFGFVPFFLRLVFVRSKTKTKVLILSLFLFHTRV